MDKAFVIAIDGPSASGKGTLARNLADTLDFAYLDTGAIYRNFALRYLKAGLDMQDQAQIDEHANAIASQLKGIDLNTPEIRTDEVAQAASILSVQSSVRAALLAFQQDFARSAEGKKGAVLDGRDIGTVICPDADLKLFVTASAEIRAKRRLKELQSKGIGVTYETVLADMHERDARDYGRKQAQLRAAEDAIIINTDGLSADAVLDQVIKIYKERV